MISKNTIKQIKSLAHKKGRTKEKLFIVEGDKNVAEVLQSEYSVERIFATNIFLRSHQNLINPVTQVFEVENDDIRKASLLQNPQNSIAVCKIDVDKAFNFQQIKNLNIYLDDIQDPGNLGTIIRICDWFGVENLFVSPGTVDFYNPKVIQASMGSFTRVKYLEIDFEEIANQAALNNMPVYGTFLSGENIYTQNLPPNALVVMGNEGNGISEKTGLLIKNRLTIPSFNKQASRAESLNVSVATSIICSEFKRNQLI